jgi:speckle-type POZ protein
MPQKYKILVPYKTAAQQAHRGTYGLPSPELLIRFGILLLRSCDKYRCVVVISIYHMAAKTWSAHRSAFVQATHHFEILGYSTLRSLGVRTSVRSGTFDAGGFPWALVCCFDPGQVRNSLASISLELSRNDTDHDVVAMATIRIEEATGTGQFPAAVWRSDRANTFRARRSAAWDLSAPDEFWNHEARYVDADADRLTIHCTVDILQQDSPVAGATGDCFVSSPPPRSISQDFHKILRGRCTPDVTFVVQDTEIRAHKLVLAMRSRVFRAQFFHGDMKAGSTRRFEIDDMSPSILGPCSTSSTRTSSLDRRKGLALCPWRRTSSWPRISTTSRG